VRNLISAAEFPSRLVRVHFVQVSALWIIVKIIRDAFNRPFTDIGPNLASQINPPRVSFRDFVESCDSAFELELLTTDELRKLVNDIPVGKADGLDGIPTSLS